MGFFRKRAEHHISFEEIFLDASNLPAFNRHKLEGKIELPLSRASMYGVVVVYALVACAFLAQLIKLQVIQGAELAALSERNRLDNVLVVAERGIITDRRGELMAWNEIDHSGRHAFPLRAYTDRRGLGQLIGHVNYPRKDRYGFYYRTEYLGQSGIEETMNQVLAGVNGEQLVEVNALGEVISEAMLKPPTAGYEVTLSIDAELSEAIHDLIATTSLNNGFRSGGAAIMDVATGELIVMTSYPSYDPEVLADGDDIERINAYNVDPRHPYLNRITSGLYTPGSIVKPFVAYAALAERVIDPMKIIVSNGSLTVPNPYNPDQPAVFNDWRVHGPMTMRDAIAYSSNVYFFMVGGGFGSQPGLGISNINRYLSLFGIGQLTGISLTGEQVGTVPSPEWKRRTFNDEWRLGDTYLTAIGQYGFQTTPIQMLRAYAALANGGLLVTPVYQRGVATEQVNLNLNQDNLRVVQEGMRAAVIQSGGTARALERKDVAIAAKSGTAELGVSKAHVNSWVAGYFPYEKPRYAFILFMEYGPRSNTVGASSVMGKVFDWMAIHRPEYF